MKKLKYISCCFLGFSCITFGIEHHPNEGLQRLTQTHVRPEFFSTPTMSSEFFRKAVAEYCTYVTNHPMRSYRLFRDIDPTSIDLHYLKQQAILAQNDLYNLERQSFGKTFRRVCYASMGSISILYGIHTFFEATTSSERDSGILVASIFTGLGAMATLFAAQSGIGHFHHYQDTKILRRKYVEFISQPLETR
jgi:hypothetical protein